MQKNFNELLCQSEILDIYLSTKPNTEALKSENIATIFKTELFCMMGFMIILREILNVHKIRCYNTECNVYGSHYLLLIYSEIANM